MTSRRNQPFPNGVRLILRWIHYDEVPTNTTWTLANAQVAAKTSIFRAFVKTNMISENRNANTAIAIKRIKILLIELSTTTEVTTNTDARPVASPKESRASLMSL